MMHQKRNIFNNWIVRFSGLIIGCLIAWLYHKTDISIFNIIGIVYNKVGVTVIALLPLSLWAAYTALRAGNDHEITLAYIGTTAQRIGLLGTVIGIVAATLAIGDNLSTGAASAVTGALPAVGQALVSTAVGFVISIICDFFIYVNSKDMVVESVTVEEKGDL
jgi:hypothetical protein